MELIVVRDKTTNEETTGRLFVDGKFFSYTLEDTTRIKKAYGDTCIPFRRDYKVKTTHSPAFNRPLPLVWNNPDLTVSNRGGDTWAGIRFHGGNHHKHTLGCILVAKNRVSTPVKMEYKGVTYTFNNTINGSMIEPLIKLIGDKTVSLKVVYDIDFKDERTVNDSPTPVFKIGKLGMSEADLCQIQNRLNIAGFAVNEPLFTASFEDAVRKFQASKNLTVDGQVGKGTLKALNLIWNGYELEQAFDYVNNKVV